MPLLFFSETLVAFVIIKHGILLCHLQRLGIGALCFRGFTPPSVGGCRKQLQDRKGKIVQWPPICFSIVQFSSLYVKTSPYSLWERISVDSGYSIIKMLHYDPRTQEIQSKPCTRCEDFQCLVAKKQAETEPKQDQVVICTLRSHWFLKGQLAFFLRQQISSWTHGYCWIGR